MTNTNNLIRNPELVTRQIDGEVVIMIPGQGKILALNEVGSFIWDMIDGTNSKESILAALCGEFEVSPEEAAVDIEEFTTVLAEKGLINFIRD